MDKRSKKQWADISHEHAQECLDRISSGEIDGAYEFAQIFMSRVPQKDIEIILFAIEAFARQSAALGCDDAKAFLAKEWTELQPVLRSRLNRAFDIKS